MSASRQSTNNKTAIQVYAPGFRHVLSIPQHLVLHMPPSSLHVTRYVLCANFDAAEPITSCPMGDRCKFVHADTRTAQRQQIHVNYAWRALTDVTYDRFPSGEQLHVAAPNSKVPTDLMDSDMVLATKALQSKRRPLSHCAHYYFNRTCNLGADCQFIHAVFVDPNAKDHQRAPVPSQLGEGRELQLSKKQREARQQNARADLEQNHHHSHVHNHIHSDEEEHHSHSHPMPVHRTYAAAPAAMATAAAPVATPVRPFVTHAMLPHLTTRMAAGGETPIAAGLLGAAAHRFEDSSANFALAMSGTSSDCDTPRHHHGRRHNNKHNIDASSSDDEHHVCRTALKGGVADEVSSPDFVGAKAPAMLRPASSCGSLNGSTGRSARFRHDPYSLAAPRVVSIRPMAARVVA